MGGSAKLGWLVLLFGAASCGSGEANEASPEASSGGEGPTLQSHMEANFDLALKARDGIVAGSLIQAREAAVQLAEKDYSTVLPADWMPAVERMKSAARELAAVPDLNAGAAAVASLAATCGECHGSFAQGDRGRPVGESDDAFGKPEDMHERMMRHERAVEGFWYGLSVPSDRAWKSGAEMLLLAPASPVGKDGKPVSEQMAGELEKVRALAQRALDAEGAQQRAAVYGEFLATCSGCHTEG